MYEILFGVRNFYDSQLFDLAVFLDTNNSDF